MYGSHSATTETQEWKSAISSWGVVQEVELSKICTTEHGTEVGSSTGDKDASSIISIQSLKIHKGNVTLGAWSSVVSCTLWMLWNLEMGWASKSGTPGMGVWRLWPGPGELLSQKRWFSPSVVSDGYCGHTYMKATNIHGCLRQQALHIWKTVNASGSRACYWSRIPFLSNEIQSRRLNWICLDYIANKCRFPKYGRNNLLFNR